MDDRHYSNLYDYLKEHVEWTADKTGVENKAGYYFIEAERLLVIDGEITDGPKELPWIEHLRGKNWFTEASEDSFIKAVGYCLLLNQLDIKPRKDPPQNFEVKSMAEFIAEDLGN